MCVWGCGTLSYTHQHPHSPVQSSPVQSSPVWTPSSPVQSSPVQSSPVQSSPVQPSPVQVRSSPVQSSLNANGGVPTCVCSPASPAQSSPVRMRTEEFQLMCVEMRRAWAGCIRGSTILVFSFSFVIFRLFLFVCRRGHPDQ